MYYYGAAAILFVIDRAIKGQIINLLDFKDALEIIPGILSFKITFNKGIAFGWFENIQIIHIMGNIIILFCLTLYLWRHKSNKHKNFGIILITIGALSNLMDRIVLGHVVDYIKIDFINFPIFNLSDVYITLGTIWAIIFIIFSKEAF